MKYEEDPRFCGYYFEDSYVLSVNVGFSQAVFDLDAVLTPQHPHYAAPLPDEFHCYRRAQLWFKDAFDISYDPSGAPPAWDANDDWDHGNIDSFEIDPPHGYHLAGGWGQLKLKALNAFVKDSGQ